MSKNRNNEKIKKGTFKLSPKIYFRVIELSKQENRSFNAMLSEILEKGLWHYKPK